MDNKTLVLTFKDNENEKKVISIADPKDGLDKDQVTNATSGIITAGIFETAKGGALQSLVKAQLVSRTTTDLV